MLLPISTATNSTVQKEDPYYVYQTVVDVGGGVGRLLCAILKATPSARGVLYDLPHALAESPPVLRQHHVADRVELVDGSFFDSVPTGDVYVLKMILHDWPDEKAVEILQTVRSAAKVGTKVLVMDCVFPDHEREFLGNGTDLEMLLLQAGRERTVPEHRSLLEHAGFRMTRRVPTASPLSFVEAEAV